MTDTIDGVPAEPVEQQPAGPATDEQGVAEQLVTQAREKGIELVGPKRAAHQSHQAGAGGRTGGRDERAHGP